MNEKEKQMPSAEDFLPDEPPLAQEAVTDMPELSLYPAMDLPQDGQPPIFAPDPVILPQESQEEALPRSFRWMQKHPSRRHLPLILPSCLWIRSLRS